MIRPHGLIAALNATENDVGLQRARHEGVTQWLATVVTVRAGSAGSFLLISNTPVSIIV